MNISSIENKPKSTLNHKSRVLEVIRKNKLIPINTITKKFINGKGDRYSTNEYDVLGKGLKEIYDKLQDLYEKYDKAIKGEVEVTSRRGFGYAQRNVKLSFSTSKGDNYRNIYEDIHKLIEDIKDSKDKVIPIKILKHEFRFYYNQEEFLMGKYGVVLSDKMRNKEQDTDLSRFVSNQFSGKIKDFVINNGATIDDSEFPEKIYDYRPIKTNL